MAPWSLVFGPGSVTSRRYARQSIERSTVVRGSAYADARETATCGKNGQGLGGAPLISVMETANFGYRDDRPGGSFGRRSVIGGVFLEREVRSGPMIVLEVG